MKAQRAEAIAQACYLTARPADFVYNITAVRARAVRSAPWCIEAGIGIGDSGFGTRAPGFGMQAPAWSFPSP